VQRIFIRLVAFGAACWLCVYPLVLTAAGILVLVGTDQGRELLEWTVHEAQRGSHRFFFHASVLAWSAATWYSCLVLLERRFEPPFGSASLESNEPFVLWLRKWMPRILGIAMYPPLAAQFLANGSPFHCLALAAVGALWWVFLLYRRSLLGLAEEPGAQRARLGWQTIAALAVAIAVLQALLVGFLFSDVRLPRFIGAAPIALLAFASWTLVGSIVFVLLPKSYRLPSLACAPLVLLVAAAWVDNHELRRLPPSGAARAASIEESAYAWLAAREPLFRQAAPGRKSIPVYIAAAEGGGLRAAYWTGSVLARLEDATGGRFSQHLFAVSAVSGGSLGAAAFAAEAAEPDCEAAEGSVERCVQRFLAQDFLSPTVAYLLFPDALQRFLPFPVQSFDRARALEAAWERSWSETHPGAPNAFAAPFEALGSSFGKTQAPRLFLNGTRVETGRRVLVSPAVTGNGEMPGVDDLLAVGSERWSLPLSAAVHLSARFTYFSPAAKICREPVEACANDAVWGRVVDGGYHENSGAQTAAGVLRAFRRAAWRFQRAHPELPRIEPQVILISNDPASGRLCEPPREPVPEHFAHELFAPIEAVINTRTARGADARRALADTAAAPTGYTATEDCAKDEARANTLEFSLSDALTEERVIALGWLLANGSTHEMQAALCAPRHAQAVREVQQALGVQAPDPCVPGLDAKGTSEAMRPVRR
jgi:hypothetical protein